MSTLGFSSVSHLDGRLQNGENSRKTWNTGMAGSQVNYKRIKTVSTESVSGLEFQIFPSNYLSSIDRTIMVETKVKFNFTGSVAGPAGPLLIQRSKDAPRGLGCIIDNMTARINGTPIDVRISDIYHALGHYKAREEHNNWGTVSPTTMCMDNCQNYADMVDSLVNPLASYRDSTYGQKGRGAYNFQIIDNTPTSAEVDCVFYEFIYIEPFSRTNEHLPGLSRVSQLQLTLNFGGYPARMWSHNSGSVVPGTGVAADGYSVIDNVTVSFSDSYVHYVEITLPLPSPVTIPPVLSYNYSEKKLVTTGGLAPLASGEPATNTTSNYQLSVVPAMVLIWVKEEKNLITNTVRNQLEKPDCYAQIQQISVENYQNASSQLASATAVDLYKISQYNGLQMSLHEFLGETWEGYGGIGRVPLTGSVVALDFAHDVSQTNSSMVPGVAINSNISFQVKYKNTSKREIKYEIHTLFIYDSIIQISNESATKYLVTQSQEEAIGNAVSTDTSPMSGGGVRFEKFRTGFKKALPTILDVASTLGEKFTPLGSLAPQLRNVIKETTGYGVQGAGVTGGGLKGGQKVTRQSLKDRL